MIPYGRQDISEADIAAVVEVLKSDFLTQGPVVPQFESAVAAYCDAAYGVAVNSATSALHMACLALGLGPGDSLWTTPITFVASANCGLYCGASVDFVDIDPRSYNMCPIVLEAKLVVAKRENRLPKVVVPVHLTGQPCDMHAIFSLGQKYGFRIIEDASHAIGGKYRGNPIGNCRYSDITIFSFHPVKIITTGEGGLALTNNSKLADTMALLRSHGITRDSDKMTQIPDGPWYYEQIELGLNYRMTELQAALGLSQLQNLDKFVADRHVLARRYDEELKDLPLLTPWQHPDGYSGLHLYVVRLRLDLITRTHREVFEFFRSNEVGVNLHYIPIYRQPYYAQMGYDSANFPEAEAYYAEAISLPMYPGLTFGKQDQVVEVIRRALGSE